MGCQRPDLPGNQSIDRPGGKGGGDGDGGSPKRARMGHVMKASILFLGDYCQIRGLEGKSEAVCASQLTACDDDGVGRRAHLCRPVLLPTSKSLLRGGRASKSARSSLSFPPSWIQLSQPWTGLAGPCPGGAISRKSCLFVPTFWSSSLLFFPPTQLWMQAPRNVHPRVWLVPLWARPAYTTSSQHREITQADITLHHAMI